MAQESMNVKKNKIGESGTVQTVRVKQRWG
jgi:hypothetical protein